MTSARAWLLSMVPEPSPAPWGAEVYGAHQERVGEVVRVGLAALRATDTEGTMVHCVAERMAHTCAATEARIAHLERVHADRALLQVLRAQRDTERAAAIAWGRVLRALGAWGVTVEETDDGR